MQAGRITNAQQRKRKSSGDVLQLVSAWVGVVILPFPRHGVSNRNVLSCRKQLQYKQGQQRSGLSKRLITANGTLQTDT